MLLARIGSKISDKCRYNTHMRHVLVLAGFVALAGLSSAAQTPIVPLFTPEERQRVLAYWATPGLYSIEPPPNFERDGLYRVRQTVEASRWLWNLMRQRVPGNGNPVLHPQATDERGRVWDAWIAQRIDHDFWLAQTQADAINRMVLGASYQPQAPAEPPHPGMVPSDLVEAAGAPHRFAHVVSPQLHLIRFEGDLTITLEDHPLLRRNFAFLRFPQGVMSVGQAVRDMPRAELLSLFADAGLDESAQRIFTSVSMLEGGFDSVNTYDTGHVSVGMIQFACLPGGGGSLGQVLLRMKRDNPVQFNQEFRMFGLDVTDDGLLVALNLSNGAEVVGSEAALRIIDDTRLIAVFQRAGRVSREFRLAQLRVARDMFFPLNDVITVTSGTRSFSVRVGDIFRSEAGIATLMDRKVRTGRLDPLPTLLAQVMREFGFSDPRRTSTVERELIRRLTLRKDYLADTTLSQPPALPVRRPQGN